MNEADSSPNENDQEETLHDESAVVSDSLADTPLDAESLDADDESSTPTPPPPAPAPKIAKPKVDSEDQFEGVMDWYILKVAFNREDSIADALRKRVKMEGMAEFFGEIVVPTEDVATFTRDGKRRVTKRKLLPGYIMVNMIINDDTWFLVRETGGISDFTGSAGKPMPMEPSDIERFVNRPELDDEDDTPIKTAIPFKVGDRVRVKEGNFENQEGDVDAVDEANGRITVIINIFGRSVPMELDHWQVEPL
ncbi:transcription termination/antitermination protein NusG [Novipirellula aureliae]|uniref:transcription termination/antitermination protein NusG n=1 Tax=Novipirellula aureliae TaxID=2527966 RepID=UPI001E659DA4